MLDQQVILMFASNIRYARRHQESGYILVLGLTIHCFVDAHTIFRFIKQTLIGHNYGRFIRNHACNWIFKLVSKSRFDNLSN